MDVILFSVSITISAFLLFWVQPLAAKFFLPILGGSPSVWQLCMVFFQGILLTGYTYAHYLSKQFELNKQILIHFSILLIGLGFIPLFSQNISPIQPEQDPNRWLLTELFTHIALPFFVISASAPLLQRWFSYTQHQNAADPYFLYAASNLGSLLALLSFPFILEPLFGNYWQNVLWAWGYIIYGGSLILISLLMLKLSQQQPADKINDIVTPVPFKTQGQWLLFAFIPSSLLLGVTTTITTDIASTPLFWIVPLTLYLVTFILSFNSRTAHWYQRFNQLQPYFICGLCVLLLPGRANYYSVATICFHLLVFTATAFICHGQLYASRPQHNQLTKFYLLIAIGGFLGGVFNSLLSPVLFNGPYEYPLILCLACLFRIPTADKPLTYKIFIPVICAALCLVLYATHRAELISNDIYAKSFVTTYFVSIILLPLLRRQRRLLSAHCAIILFLFPTFYNANKTTIFQQRNFFGVLKIEELESINLRTLLHGTTLHGVQYIKNTQQDTHQSYYVPLKQVALSLHNHNRPARIAVAGLGVGSLACIIGNKEQELTFYEIDPDVINIAKDNTYFDYLTRCTPKGGIVLGDARLSLEKAAQHHYDLMVLDAFSSDSVPIHLINLEAIELYLEKLEPYGLLAFNISNRHIDLIPVLAAICNKLDLQCYSSLHITKDIHQAFNSRWVFIARKDVNVVNTLATNDWRRLPNHVTSPLWTDDFSNIITLIR